MASKLNNMESSTDPKPAADGTDIQTASQRPRPPKLAPRRSSTQDQQKEQRPKPPKLPAKAPSSSSNKELSQSRSRPPKLPPKQPSQSNNVSGSEPISLSVTPVDKPERPSAQRAPSSGQRSRPPKLGPRGSYKKENADSKKENDESLTTILDVRQRTQLTILLAAATATMRDALDDTFDATATLSPNMKSSESMTEDEKIMNPNVHTGEVDVAIYDKERKLLAEREKELSAPKMRELRDAALDWFDDWRVGVIGRVGEVLNSKKEAKKQLDSSTVAENKSHVKDPENKKVDPQDHATSSRREAEEKEFEMLKELYPPVTTPLAKLDEDKRVLILHSMLLLLLSMENYQAPSRILLLYLVTSLNIMQSVLNKDEQKTAQGLLEHAKELSGASATENKAAENRTARKWKVGIASVAGAAVIGITGGMAAPLVAAGVGSIMGGLGLGATAAAGYLGSLAGSTVLVGGLFGAYGGRMTGQMMDNYAREVSDFAFIPVRPDKYRIFGSTSKPHSEKGEEATGKQSPGDRRLRVTIGISGWLTEKEEVATPWRVIGDNSEVFALRWELESLMTLGNAMQEMVSSAAWGYAKKEIVSRTILAEMMSAMWPLALLKVSRVIDNPFSVAKSRAEKTGAVLADALVNRAQGERPVTLIGYSLGARVIYACLHSLAARRAFGLIENVVLIGAPIPSDAKDWTVLRSVVSGRLINVYSENDYVLGFMYRTSSIQLGVAGLQPITDVKGIENVDVSETVSGHLRYRYLVGQILQKIGFEDIDVEDVKREEKALQEMDEAERQRNEKLKQHIPDRYRSKSKGSQDKEEAEEADREAEKMEQSIRERTQQMLMQKGAELLKWSGTGEKDGKASGKYCISGENSSRSLLYLLTVFYTADRIWIIRGFPIYWPRTLFEPEIHLIALLYHLFTISRPC